MDDIEMIKQLKARYFRTMDTKDYGHYHETYEKIGGAWRIRSSKLTRLRMELNSRSDR